MSYSRTLPRDAFNEANLLKCIGKLTLLIEDKMIDLDYEYDGDPFDIYMDESDGSISVRNVEFYTVGEYDKLPIYFHRPLNSRKPWPLLDSEGNAVFNDEGEYIYDVNKITDI
jgi:hypothetical protein